MGAANRDYDGDVQDEQCVSHGSLSENARRSFPVVPNLGTKREQEERDIGALSKNRTREKERERATKR